MSEINSPFDPMDEKFSAYRGMWVALIGDKIVGQGTTESEAKRAAALSHRRDKPLLRFIPPLPILNLPTYFFEIQHLSKDTEKVYLVGGAVRDMLLQKPINDLDFVVKENVQSFARKIANALNGAYYCMNEEFDVARVIFHWNGVKQVADFVSMQGETIEEDLQKRDFTVNAIAMDIFEPSYLIDPLNGALDLLDKKLQLCANNSISDDPIRILRAIRCALTYELRMTIETIKAIESEKRYLMESSNERVRDELFKIFKMKCVKPAYLLMHHFEIDKILFSNTENVQDLTSLFNALDQLFSLFSPTERAVNQLQLGMTYTVLHPYINQLKTRFAKIISEERTDRELVYFSLFTSQESLKHDIQRFRLSNSEHLKLRKIINNYEKVEKLELEEERKQKLDIYHFYSAVNENGFATIYLAIAHMLHQQQNFPNIQEIDLFLNKCDCLFDAWFNHFEEAVDPPQLVDGRLLMRKLRIKPGPKVGEIIESIREAQIVGDVKTDVEAISYGKNLVK